MTLLTYLLDELFTLCNKFSDLEGSNVLDANRLNEYRKRLFDF